MAGIEQTGSSKAAARTGLIEEFFSVRLVNIGLAAAQGIDLLTELCAFQHQGLQALDVLGVGELVAAQLQFLDLGIQFLALGQQAGKARITLDFNLLDFQTMSGIPRMNTTNSTVASSNAKMDFIDRSSNLQGGSSVQRSLPAGGRTGAA